MEMLENLRSQNSTCPLQGRVLVGRGGAEAVAEAVPFSESVEGDRPTMAVRSSVVVEVVAVALDLPVAVEVKGMPKRLPEALTEASLGARLESASDEAAGASVVEATRLLGVGLFDIKEEDCECTHDVRRAKGTKNVKGIMRKTRRERTTNYALADSVYRQHTIEVQQNDVLTSEGSGDGCHGVGSS